MTPPVNSDVYPEIIARFYDAVYDSIRTQIDRDFYLHEIQKVRGAVLEIGVGTGRIFCAALEKGTDIYGFDLSPAMIARLKEKINPMDYHRVSVQNAVNFHFNRKFDLIIAPFRMFSHLMTIDDQLMTLNNIYTHLTDDGTFIFDVFVPNLKMLIEGIDSVIDFEGVDRTGRKFKRIISMCPDQINQTTNSLMQFDWEEDGRNFSSKWEFQMRYFFRYELEHLIARSGLTLQTILGDFQGNPLSENSGEFIVVTSKLPKKTREKNV
ncbi:MAG: class I SAM-dependent methyltransferase [Candidatus Marinimicrobia bacterium]|nr:class I SAM-dependent methyltransferase [Candidatus Neomarinimicrobiota bacterium]